MRRGQGSSAARRRTALLGAVLALAVSAAAEAGEWRFADVGRIVVISDVHGAYDAMAATLVSASVIDEKLSWSGKDTHLVITGDLLDRGAHSRQVLDLLMRLEKEAIRAGGRVHMLLGNHDVMNMIGDLRYVARGEYAAFAAEERAGEREFWFRHFVRARSGSRDLPDAGSDTLRSEFAKRAPPGFFAHRRAFSTDGEYGRWLLDKPFLIVINDTAFVHGGLPEYVVEQGLNGVNRNLKRHLVGYLAAREQLEEHGVLSPVDGFRAHVGILEAELGKGSLNPALSKLADTVITLKESPLHGSEGPLWYRGSAVCSGPVEGALLRAALTELDASRVVIGHTTTWTRQVETRLDGRVIAVNTGMLRASYGGSGQALVIEDGLLSVTGEQGETRLEPVPAPRRPAGVSRHTDDRDLAVLLASGVVLDPLARSAERSRVRVKAGGKTVLAVFDRSAPDRKRKPELAAYKLDRLLGLDMVPVTVRRQIEGYEGTLQWFAADPITESERAARYADDSQACPVDKQIDAMRVFDALIGNDHRSTAAMLYADDDWRLMLVDHRRAFGYAPDARLPAGRDGLDVEWRALLRNLDDDRLRSTLSDALGERELQALAARRDALLRAGVGEGDSSLAAVPEKSGPGSRNGAAFRHNAASLAP